MLSRPILTSALFIALVVVPATRASAHPILPEQFQEYLREHPNASIEEIQQWVDYHHNATSTEQVTELIEVAASDAGFWENALAFVKLGMEHIFIGIDHILFLVAMMLTYVSFREILKLTGTFTIAHSVTLILSGTLLLSLSARIVGPIIAFSIAFVALSTVFLNREGVVSTRGKLATIFLFGLVHGMGFAGVLQDFHVPADKFLSSLIFFNVGIEIGQLVLVAVLIVPILYLIRKTPWNHRIIQAIAALISLVGIYWGIERIIG